MSRASLLIRHGEIAAELARLHRELASVLAVEREAKVRAYASNPGSDKMCEHAGAFQALEQTKAQFQIRGDIGALVEERDHIRLQLAYDGFSDAD